MEALMSNKRRKVDATSRHPMATEPTKADENNNSNTLSSKQLKYPYNDSTNGSNSNTDKTGSTTSNSGGSTTVGGGAITTNNTSTSATNNNTLGYNNNKVYTDSSNVLVSRYLSADKIYPSHDTCKLEARHLDERPIQSQDLSSSSTELSDKTKFSDHGKD